MPEIPPRKGSVLQLNRRTNEMGKLGKVIEKNDTTKKAIVRLFYNGSDRVLNYSQLQPKGNNKEKPALNYFDPYKMPDSYNMDRLRSPIPEPMLNVIASCKYPFRPARINPDNIVKAAPHLK